MLEVEAVSSGYGLIQILWDVSFKVGEKEKVLSSGEGFYIPSLIQHSLLGTLQYFILEY